MKKESFERNYQTVPSRDISSPPIQEKDTSLLELNVTNPHEYSFSMEKTPEKTPTKE